MKEPFEWPETWTEDRREVLATLWWDLHLNGPISDESGKATALLQDRLTALGIRMTNAWLNKNLKEIGSEGEVHLVDREVRGKRTYGIQAFGSADREGFPPCPSIFSRRRPVEQVEIVDGESDGPVPPARLPEVIDDIEPSIEPDGETPYNKCLFAISILTGLLEDLTRVPDGDIDQLLDRKLGAVNRLIEDRERLREELAEAKAKNQALLTANRKLESSLLFLQRSR